MSGETTWVDSMGLPTRIWVWFFCVKLYVCFLVIIALICFGWKFYESFGEFFRDWFLYGFFCLTLLFIVIFIKGG